MAADFMRPEHNINMERGDGIIRWSPNRSRDEFLTINLTYRTLDLHKATGKIQPGGADDDFQHQVISKHTDFQSFSAYDWSPVTPHHDMTPLLAVGSKTGDVHLLRIDDDSSDSISLPLKIPRSCHAVAFNPTGLLAVGLDRVRNDHCLHIWDINQRLLGWDPTKKGFQNLSASAEPYMRLEPSVPISSTRWFEDQPMTLVAGVKSQSLRMHDLRDPSGAVISFQTKCTNNLAINHKDPNYFASSSLDSPGVLIWDRRASSRSTSSRTYTDAVDSNDMPWGCVLKLDRVIDPYMNTHIRSLRYCRDHSSLLGVLSTAGQLQFIETEKERLDYNTDDVVEGSAELLEVAASHDVAYPWFSKDFQYSPDERIVSFDWVPIRSGYHQPRVVARKSDHKVEVILKPSGVKKFAMDLLDFSSKAKHKSRGALPQFTSPQQAQDILKPVLEEPAKAALSVEINRPLTATNAKDGDTKDLPIKIQAIQISAEDGTENNELDLMPRKSKYHALDRIPSSRDRHEKLLSCISTGKSFDINQPDRIENLMLDRIRRGYIFNCKRNLLVLQDDPWLQDVWTWVEGAEEAVANGAMVAMVAGHLDLAYMGVHGIWNNDLGSQWQSRSLIHPDCPEVPGEEEWARVLEDLNTMSGRVYDATESVETKRPHHRLMCLAICGWGKSEDELEQDLQKLEARGLHSKAAAWALFERKGARAVKALQRGGPKLLFMGLALGLTLKTKQALTKDDWDYSTSDLSDIKDDPYLRAIYTVISTGDMKSICNETSLPLRDRVGVALHNLNDTELPNWLNRQTTEAISSGDIEGIVLTGISAPFVELLTRYIERFGDYQTATLLIHFAAPLYITDYRIDQWRAEYQDLHNRNRLYVQRCHYDVGSTKLSRNREGISVIKPKPRQVTLRCTHCDTAFANDLDNTSMRPATRSNSLNPERSALHSSKAHSGICCPKCGKHLPRCGICLLTLGMPRSDKDIFQSRSGSGQGSLALARLKNFMSFCMKCDHAFHADHARGWFRVHNECPVPECHCACNVDGGGMAGYEREDEG